MKGDNRRGKEEICMKKFGFWSKISIVVSIFQLLLAIFKEIQNYNESKESPSKNKKG